MYTPRLSKTRYYTTSVLAKCRGETLAYESMRHFGHLTLQWGEGKINPLLSA